MNRAYEKVRHFHFRYAASAISGISAGAAAGLQKSGYSLADCRQEYPLFRLDYFAGQRKFSAPPVRLTENRNNL